MANLQKSEGKTMFNPSVFYWTGAVLIIIGAIGTLREGKKMFFIPLILGALIAILPQVPPLIQLLKK